MITKTSGSFVVTPIVGWYQDYRPDPNNPREWVPHGRKVTWSVAQKNGSLSTITYDGTPIKRGGLKTTKFCHHVVQQVRNYNTFESHYLSSTSPNRREGMHNGNADPIAHVIPNLASLHVEALDFFKAGCSEKEFSLAVNLLEIREIPRLLTDLPTIFKRLKSQKKRYKGVANAHLWYSFGLAPLVSDIKAAVSTLSSLHQRIKWFRENEGKPVRVRFRKDLSKSLCPATTHGSDPTGWWCTRSTSFRASYQAHATIRYRTELLNDLELKLRVLTRNFGLDNPIEWAWERIPFSFILDWFVSIGRFLEALGPKITIPCDILDCGWAVKIEETRMFEAWRHRPYQSSGKTIGWEASTRTYHREPGLPISFSLVSNDPGLSQLALGVSLFIQRMK